MEYNKDWLQEQLELNKGNLDTVRAIMKSDGCQGKEYLRYVDEEMNIIANISYLEKELSK